MFNPVTSISTKWLILPMRAGLPGRASVMVIQQTPDLDTIAVIATLHQRPNFPQELLDIRS
jgi:hypothetical protein